MLIKTVFEVYHIGDMISYIRYDLRKVFIHYGYICMELIFDEKEKHENNYCVPAFFIFFIFFIFWCLTL